MGKSRRLKQQRRELSQQRPEPDAVQQNQLQGPVPVSSSDRLLELLGILLVSGLVFLIYANSLGGDFVFDDENNIKDNVHIRITSLNPADVMKAGLDSPHPRRFLAYVSFALNYYVHQDETFGYRLVNILIHITTGVLLYYLLKTTLGLTMLRASYSRQREIAFFVALIWLVHPLAVQSVAYIVQRMNSLAALFYLLSILFYVRARLSETMRKKLALFAGCSISGLLALASKENAITLPAFLALYEWYFLQNLSPSWLKRRALPVLAVLVGFAAIAIVILGVNSLQSFLSYATRDFTMTERVMTEFRVVMHYLSVIVYPHPSRLSLEHDFAVSHSLLDPITTLLSLAAIFAMLGLAWFTAKRARLISFCILWYLGHLVIESSIIPLEIIFEHRTYLPSMGILLILVCLLYRHVEQHWVPVSVLCLVTLVFSFWTFQRSAAWASPVNLYRDVVQKYPGSARSHANLGAYLLKQGDTKEAIAHLSEAIRIQPAQWVAHASLGKAYSTEGKTEEADRHFRASIRIKPNAPALSNFGGSLLQQHQYQEAADYLHQALILNPNVSQTHYNLGVALSNMGEEDDAISYYREAIRIEPGNADALDNLGIILARRGNLEEALHLFSEAVRADPNHANALAHLGIALLQQGQTQQAIIHFRKALRIRPGHPDALRYLELALQQAEQINSEAE